MAQLTTPIDDSNFPYCRCSDYSCQSSPWRLQLQSQSELEAGVRTTCLTVVKQGCNPRLPCCQIMSKKLDKMEFSIGGWRDLAQRLGPAGHRAAAPAVIHCRLTGPAPAEPGTAC